MDKAYPVSTPVVVRTLEKNKDPFRPRERGEELLCPEVPYLSAIGALMYLANCTRPDIAFSVNLLARHSSAPTRRHWTGVKQIFRYLRGTMDMGLFYSKDSKIELVGYVDVGYRSDPHKGRSQTGYVFTYGDTAISWRSTKQTPAATSSNHAELLALHETSRECVWLRPGKATLKEIEQSTLIQNSSSLTNFSRGEILMFVKFAHVKIQQICLQKHFQHLLSRS
ncbi:secreted RxLR effector protein 161-like [Daucus carota subsp. sativus]|uniref:secreted RxLR effector protein 161-like n=1 Tax=Daucus carota subsp. sativus TaxID=79200 RepID=UPI003083C9B7